MLITRVLNIEALKLLILALDSAQVQCTPRTRTALEVSVNGSVGIITIDNKVTTVVTLQVLSLDQQYE